ncbi:MAG: hypothetical protein E6I33_05060 [Chloroflexi bacterium]|nr:MAG: hypothetical protein E6I33_05060 [Chloroflexota bacterium]
MSFPQFDSEVPGSSSPLSAKKPLWRGGELDVALPQAATAIVADATITRDLMRKPNILGLS